MNKKGAKIMLSNKNNRNKEAILIVGLLALAVLFLLSTFPSSFAQQTGATVTNMSQSAKSASSPNYNNGTKGYIHTVNLNAEQQDNKWKAYVGNVSSTFVLDDSNDYSIYQWTLDSFSGQIYITRDSSITWTGVGCASAANKLTEDTSIGHNSQSADSVNRTFSSQTHKNLTVGSTPIWNNTCFSTVTWQNDANHELNSSAPFQEILLWDGSDVIYTSFVENDKQGYRPGTTYDFQAIVPDNATASAPNLRYYFYLELS
jgi:hypothetical protein